MVRLIQWHSEVKLSLDVFQTYSSKNIIHYSAFVRPILLAKLALFVDLQLCSMTRSGNANRGNANLREPVLAHRLCNYQRRAKWRRQKSVEFLEEVLPQEAKLCEAAPDMWFLPKNTIFWKRFCPRQRSCPRQVASSKQKSHFWKQFCPRQPRCPGKGFLPKVVEFLK